MNQDKYENIINEYLCCPPAKNMIIDSLKEILPSKTGGKIGFILSFIFATLLAIKIGFDEKTVTLTLTSSQNILTALLAIFACLFSVYSILLAFLSDSYIKKLLNIDYDKKTCYLKKSTTYYESVLFLYFLAISLSGILVLFLNCIDNNFLIINNTIICNIISMGLLIVYFTFVFRVFYELKSVIYNTILLFRNSIAYKILAFYKEEVDKDGEN